MSEPGAIVHLLLCHVCTLRACEGEDLVASGLTDAAKL